MGWFKKGLRLKVQGCRAVDLIREQVRAGQQSGALAVFDLPDLRAQAGRRSGGEFLEKIGEGLFHTDGIFNPDAGDFQGQGGETHGHAMVIVGFDLGAVQGGGVDGEGIALLDHFRAALGQFGTEGDDTLAFLDAEATEVGKTEQPKTVPR